MEAKINELKQQLNAIECSLEVVYAKISEHHKRMEFEEAAGLFKVQSQLNKMAHQLTERIRFYEAAQRLGESGTRVNVCRKVVKV